MSGSRLGKSGRMGNLRGFYGQKSRRACREACAGVGVRAEALEGRVLLSGAWAPVGVEYALTPVGGGFAYPAIAMNDQGQAVVASITTEGVWLRRLNAEGAPVGEAALVEGSASSFDPAVAINNGGEMVVGWASYPGGGEGRPAVNNPGFVQRFNADGQPTQPAFRMSQGVMPSVAINDAGIAMAMASGTTSLRNTGGDWTSFATTATPTRIYPFLSANGGNQFVMVSQNPAVVQLIDEGGNVFTDAVALGETPHKMPDIAMDGQGGFVAVWHVPTSGGSYSGIIHARQFDAQGQPKGAIFQVNNDTTGGNYRPVIAADAEGNFVVAWRHNGDAIHARYFHSTGAPAGNEFTVHQKAQDSKEGGIDVAMDAEGNTTVVWSSTTYGSYVPRTLYAQRLVHLDNPASVSGVVWKDVNGDGIREGSEPVLPGVTVELIDDTGQVRQTTISVSNGAWSFGGLRAGVPYAVRFVAPDGMALTQQNRGTNELADSDVESFTGKSAAFTLTEGQSDLRLDAGMSASAMLSGMVYYDRNRDGARQGQDYGLPGWRLFIDANENGAMDEWELTTRTDEAGEYTFVNVPPGEWLVRAVAPTQWTVGEQGALVEVVPGGVHGGVDFAGITDVPVGAFAPKGTEFVVNTPKDAHESSSRVFANSSGDHVIMWWYRQTLLAKRFNAAGAALTGEFVVAQTAYAADAAMDDSGNFVVVYRIDGRWEARRFDPAGNPAGPAIVISTNADPDTSLDVIYDESGGFLVVWENRYSGFSINYRRYDASGTPLMDARALVKDDNTRGKIPSVGLTPDGFLLAWGQVLEGGNGKIQYRRFDLDGNALGPVEVIPANTTRIEVAAGEEGDYALVWSSTDTTTMTSAIYARRFTADGEPLGDAARISEFFRFASYYGFTAAMDPNGQLIVVWVVDRGTGTKRDVYARRFSAAGVPQGPALRVNTVTAEQQHSASVAAWGEGFVVAWTGSAPGAAYADVRAQRYVSTMNAGAIEGSVWEDLDGDGAREAGEPALGGAVVTLYDEQGRALWETATDEDGRYRFDDVVPGVGVSVGFAAPQGYAWLTGQANDNDVDLVGRTAVLVLDEGQLVADVDAGAVPTADLRGSVYVDENRNGQHDASEYVLAGCIVYLDANDNGAFDEGEPNTTTDSSGRYAFFALRYGWYRLGLKPDALWKLATEESALNVRLPDAAGADIAVSADPLAPTPVITGSEGADRYMLRRKGESVEVYREGSGFAIASFEWSALNSVRFEGLGGDDALVIDYAGGDPVPAGGVWFEGGEGIDVLTVAGTTASDAVRLNDAGGEGLGVSGVERIVLGDGTGGAVGSLSIEGALKVEVAGERRRVELGALALGAAATMDLGSSTLVLACRDGVDEAAKEAMVRGWVMSAQENGGGVKWQGPGLTSALAAANPEMYTLTIQWAEVADGTALIARAAAYGDANLDGNVDADDYFRIDRARMAGLAGWENGDLDENGVVDADDYQRMDAAYLRQASMSGAGNGGAAAMPVEAELGVSAAAVEWDAPRKEDEVFLTDELAVWE